MKKYTEQETEFLKSNYIKLGRQECARQLGRTALSIKSKCRKLGIKNTQEQTYQKQVLFNTPKAGEFTVDENLFINNLNYITSYLLGFIWADGYLRIEKRQNGTKKYRIIIGINSEDAKYLQPLLETTGKWSTIHHKTPQKGKPCTSFCSANTILGGFLESNDFNCKATKSPDKILSKIPPELHHFFFLGYLDGDGCIFAKENNKHYCIAFTSDYNQDWTFLSNLCKKLECKFTIKQVIRKTRKSQFSDFRINGYKNCILFGSFVYQNGQIGFPRKKEKFNLIIQKIKEHIYDDTPLWNNNKEKYLKALNMLQMPHNTIPIN